MMIAALYILQYFLSRPFYTFDGSENTPDFCTLSFNIGHKDELACIVFEKLLRGNLVDRLYVTGRNIQLYIFPNPAQYTIAQIPYMLKT